MYDTSDITRTLKSFLTNLQVLLDKEPLPPKLCINPLIMRLPGVGYLHALNVTWYGKRTKDLDNWITKLAALAPTIGPPPQETIKQTNTVEAMVGVTSTLPHGCHGHFQSISLKRWSPQVIDTYVKHVESMVDGTGILFHELRACSPSAGTPDQFPGSIFNQRQPHILIEILPMGNSPEDAVPRNKWAAACRDGLAQTDAALKWNYPSLMAPEHSSPEKFWGETATELKQLKKELDPTGVFKSFPSF